MNILYIAYSCFPSRGSEDAIGWNIPKEIAKTDNVFVLTIEDHREYIERYLKEHQISNPQFFYMDIPQGVKKFFAGSLYPGRLYFYNRQARKAVREICRKEQIDIVHQITPVEFRNIGDFADIPGTVFVCGPIGGGEYIPKPLKDYGGKKIFEILRRIINSCHKNIFKWTKKLNRCDRIMFANHETANYLRPCLSADGDVLPEIGISREALKNEIGNRQSGQCRLLVAGRLIYRKGHMFLLDALERLPENVRYTCRILGDGPEMAKLRRRCEMSPKLAAHVSLEGAIPYSQMEEAYRNADVFVMPSLRETTGTVVLEAMAYGLPVITVNRFGACAILDDSTGWLFDGDTRENCIEALKNVIEACIAHPQEVSRRGENARKRAEMYTWEEKVRYYRSVYAQLLGQSDSKNAF